MALVRWKRVSAFQPFVIAFMPPIHGVETSRGRPRMASERPLKHHGYIGKPVEKRLNTFEKFKGLPLLSNIRNHAQKMKNRDICPNGFIWYEQG
jgi:hypothetical protein